MRLADSAHTSRPWRIHELTRDFGPLGRAYMAAIAPFRHLVVYQTMMRDIERAWRQA